MQLVAIGAQDLFLSYNPEITYFDTSHRSYTNFAMESMEQLFQGSLSWGKQATCLLTRTGDLVHGMYLQVELPALTLASVGAPTGPNSVAWTNNLGHALINSVTLSIGGVPIDKHYGRWMAIWHELTFKEEHRSGMNEMLCRSDDESVEGNANRARTLYVPLQFWFCRHIGASLPLVALQFHDCQIKVELNNLNALVVYLDSAGGRWDPGAGNPSPPAVPNSQVELSKITLYADVIYLDNDERQRFAREDHLYLIEQVQYNGSEAVQDFSQVTDHSIRLNFNHPTKELIFTAQHSLNYAENPIANDWFNYSTSGPGVVQNSWDLLGTAQLKLNSHDRFSPARKPGYFRLVQPANHHTRVPNKQIYVYSFCISPEQAQPSGSCNFSRIDNAQLQLKSTSDLPAATAAGVGASWSGIGGRYEVWAVSMNQLKVSGGLAGLQFAN